MNAIKNIMDILSACGCSPAATTDKNGNTFIKVNAPIIEPVTTLFDTDRAEYDFMEDRKQ
jgi:hypothetical protein